MFVRFPLKMQFNKAPKNLQKKLTTCSVALTWNKVSESKLHDFCSYFPSEKFPHPGILCEEWLQYYVWTVFFFFL